MITHLGPRAQKTNGVWVYSQLIDTIIPDLQAQFTDANITHIEIGYDGATELWRALRVKRREAGGRLVLTIHDPPVVVNKVFKPWVGNRYLRKLLDLTIGRGIVRRVMRQADAIIVLNPLAKPVLCRAFNLPESRVAVSYLPDLLTLKPSPRKASPTQPILFFGNLAQHKGLHVLLDAYRLAALDSPTTPLQIVGAWGDNQAYRTTIEQMAAPLKHCHFLGAVSDEELRLAITRATIVVLPYTDNSGIIQASGPLVASWAAGRPVVASDIPIFQGYVANQQNGVLVPPADSAQLADALKRLLASPPRQRELGTAGVQFVQAHCTPEAITNGLAEIYSRV